MRPERHPVSIEKANRHRLMPDPLVTIPSPIAVYQISAEGHLCEEQDRAAGFQDPPVLLPQLVKRDRHIPCVLRGPIGQIRKNHIDGVVRDFVHLVQAITLIKVDHTTTLLFTQCIQQTAGNADPEVTLSSFCLNVLLRLVL